MKRSRPYISSPAQEGDSLQTSFLDMIPSVPSNGTPTVAPSSGNGPRKDGSQACKCSRETLGCSLHPTGRDEWIASMRVSLASLTPLLESARTRMTTETSGLKSSDAFGRFDRHGSFLKTSPELFPTGSLGPSSEAWPASGMMRDGQLFAASRLRFQCTGTDGFVWRRPCARDWKGYTTRAGKSICNQLRHHGMSGKPNPRFLEWLLGFPLGWIKLKDLEIRKSRSKRPSRSKS